MLARARQVMATYADMEELIRLGAYRPGSSPEVDEAIALHPALEAFLGQAKEESTSLSEGYQRLAQILAAGRAPGSCKLDGIAVPGRRPLETEN